MINTNTEWITTKEIIAVAERAMLRLLAEGPQTEIALSRVAGYDPTDANHARTQLRKILGRIAVRGEKLAPNLWQWRAR